MVVALICAFGAVFAGYLLAVSISEAARLLWTHRPPHDGWFRSSIFLGVVALWCAGSLVLAVRSYRRATRII